jgi:defect-in-organelle-trafficking protein DotC
MNRVLAALSLACALALALPAHAQTAETTTTTPPSLDDVLNLHAPSMDGVPDLRAKMLADAARTIGFRAGIANRGNAIKTMLDNRDQALDAMYQFGSLIGPGGVLPPVIVEGRDAIAYAPDQMRSATRVYKIVRHEQFVSVPPTWRDYLYVGLVGKADIAWPPTDVRPKNKAEKKVWDDSARAGWAAGEKQAQAIFEADLNRLTRDYDGMLRYQILKQQGMISPTRVAESTTAVTGDTLEIKLNDRVRRITEKATLRPNPATWVAPVTTAPAETKP